MPKRKGSLKYVQTYNQWSVGGSPTLFPIIQSLLNKTSGNKSSPLHCGFQAAVSISKGSLKTLPAPYKQNPSSPPYLAIMRHFFRPFIEAA